MMAHGRLFAVVRGLSRRQSLLYKISRVFEDDTETFTLQVIPLLAAQAETPAERRLLKSVEQFIQIAHCNSSQYRVPLRPTLKEKRA
jgi:hypothetical protein